MILCFLCFQRQSFLLIFYSTVAGVVPCGGRKKSPPFIITVQVIFYFLWDHWTHPGYFGNWIPLKPTLGGVCSLANYSVAYEETQSNEALDFRDFVCLFPKAIPFYSYFYVALKIECRGQSNSINDGIARLQQIPLTQGLRLLSLRNPMDYI